MKLGDLLMVEVGKISLEVHGFAKFGKTKLIQTYLELKCLCALVPKF